MIRLFHVSDVHFGREDPAAIAWFTHCVHSERPDAVIMTGDLTMRARSHEFDAGLAWLKSLPVPVTIEVGNHDLPYFNPLARLFRPYHRIRKVERAIEKPLTIPGIAVVPMRTTSRFQLRLNWSKGNVSRAELRKAVALIEAAPKDAVVFVAAHHPLIEPHTQASAETHNGADALKELAEAGAKAVLTGHVHDAFDIQQVIDGHSIRLIGAGTLSTRTRAQPPSFNELRVDGGAFEVICRTITPEPDTVLPVERPEPA